MIIRISCFPKLWTIYSPCGGSSVRIHRDPPTTPKFAEVILEQKGSHLMSINAMFKVIKIDKKYPWKVWKHPIYCRSHDVMRARPNRALIMSWGRQQVAPPWRHGAPPDWVSWCHEGATWWLPHDVMRALPDGAPMTSWGRHLMAPSWRHEGATWWLPHDVMRAPPDGSLMMSWGRQPWWLSMPH